MAGTPEKGTSVVAVAPASGEAAVVHQRASSESRTAFKPGPILFSHTEAVSGHRAGDVTRFFFPTTEQPLTFEENSKAPFLGVNLLTGTEIPTVDRKGENLVLVSSDGRILQFTASNTGKSAVVVTQPVTHLDVDNGRVGAYEVDDAGVKGPKSRLDAKTVVNIWTATGAKARLDQLIGQGIASSGATLKVINLLGKIIAEGSEDQRTRVEIDKMGPNGAAELRDYTDAIIGEGRAEVKGDEVSLNGIRVQQGVHDVTEQGLIHRSPSVDTHILSNDGMLRVGIAVRQGTEYPEVSKTESGAIVISGPDPLLSMTGYPNTFVNARGVPSLERVNLLSKSSLSANEVGGGDLRGEHVRLYADILSGTLLVKGNKQLLPQNAPFVDIDKVVEGGLLVLYNNSLAKVGEGPVRVRGEGSILNGKAVPEGEFDLVDGNIVGVSIARETKYQASVIKKAHIHDGAQLTVDKLIGAAELKGSKKYGVTQVATLQIEKASGFLKLRGETNVQMKHCETGTIVISSGQNDMVNGQQLENKVYEVVNQIDPEFGAVGFRLVPVSPKRASEARKAYAELMGEDQTIVAGKTYQTDTGVDWNVVDVEPEGSQVRKGVIISDIGSRLPRQRRSVRERLRQVRERVLDVLLPSTEGSVINPLSKESIPGTRNERIKYALDGGSKVSLVTKIGYSLPGVTRDISGTHDFVVRGSDIQRLDVPGGARVDATQSDLLQLAHAYAGGQITATSAEKGSVLGPESKLDIQEVGVLEVVSYQAGEQNRAEARVQLVKKALLLSGNSFTRATAIEPGTVVIAKNKENYLNGIKIPADVYRATYDRRINGVMLRRIEDAGEANSIREQYAGKPNYDGLRYVDSTPVVTDLRPEAVEERARLTLRSHGTIVDSSILVSQPEPEPTSSSRRRRLPASEPVRAYKEPEPQEQVALTEVVDLERQAIYLKTRKDFIAAGLGEPSTADLVLAATLNQVATNSDTTLKPGEAHMLGKRALQAIVEKKFDTELQDAIRELSASRESLPATARNNADLGRSILSKIDRIVNGTVEYFTV